MEIKQPYLDHLMTCPACDPAWLMRFRNTPDMVMGHLMEYHDLSASDAENAVQLWMEEQDDKTRGCD